MTGRFARADLACLAAGHRATDGSICPRCGRDTEERTGLWRWHESLRGELTERMSMREAVASTGTLAALSLLLTLISGIPWTVLAAVAALVALTGLELRSRWVNTSPQAMAERDLMDAEHAEFERRCAALVAEREAQDAAHTRVAARRERSIRRAHLRGSR